MKQAVFFGLGSDGTVGLTKTHQNDRRGHRLYAQGYFVYDSKKAGAMTVSHLRFGPAPIRSTYLIRQAEFVACHRFDLLHQINVLDYTKPGGIFLLNSPAAPSEVWDRCRANSRSRSLDKDLSFYAIDANTVAARLRHGRAHQHHHADLFLRHLRRAGEGRGHRQRSSTRSRKPTANKRRRRGAAELSTPWTDAGEPQENRLSRRSATIGHAVRLHRRCPGKRRPISSARHRRHDRRQGRSAAR